MRNVLTILFRLYVWDVQHCPEGSVREGLTMRFGDLNVEPTTLLRGRCEREPGNA